MFSIHKSGRLATPGIKKATIEEAVEIALMMQRGSPGESVWIENLATGQTYRGSEIEELRRHLDG